MDSTRANGVLRSGDMFVSRGSYFFDIKVLRSLLVSLAFVFK